MLETLKDPTMASVYDGSRELGGMERGRCRMAQKLTLRILVGDADGFMTSFGISVKVWHPLEIYVTFSSKVLLTMIFPRTNFFSFTMQTPRKTQISLMTAMDRST